MQRKNKLYHILYKTIINDSSNVNIFIVAKFIYLFSFPALYIYAQKDHHLTWQTFLQTILNMPQ
jgi:hypothetical protein